MIRQMRSSTATALGVSACPVVRWSGVTYVDVESWRDELDGLLDLVGPRFGRSEPRERARRYVGGLVAGLERKNGWTLAEHAGEVSPDGMQRLLRRADWNIDGVRDDIRTYVVDRLGHTGAVLVADDTGFVKKGDNSAGVQRQYTGTSGKTDNCQIGTFLAYVAPAGHALIDRHLYLPESWIEDRNRCQEAGIPDDAELRTKPRVALDMLQRAIDAGVPFTWFTADEAFGQVKYLRGWLEEQDVFHVVATRCNDDVSAQGIGSGRVDAIIDRLPARAWRRMSCGDGAHGPRVYDWVRVPIRPYWAPGRGHWLLARRSISDPSEIAYYICYAPRRTTLATLIWVAGRRWPVEECFKQAKQETGLDHYQVRTWRGWYAHITLSMLALAWLAAVRAAEHQKGEPAPTPSNSSPSPCPKPAG
jgi:SRSO17 transposase